MKRYNVEPHEREFSWGKMLVVVLGEKGRGRYESLIPYHAPKEAEYLDIGVTKSGKPKIVKGESPNGKWLAVVSGEGVYTRNTYGTVYCLPKDKDKIRVIARGRGAYGQAGRIGSWYEFLIVVPDGTLLKVRPAGGEEKRPRYWLYFGGEKVVKIGAGDELDIFCDQMDIERPSEDFGDLVDLANLRG